MTYEISSISLTKWHCSAGGCNGVFEKERGRVPGELPGCGAGQKFTFFHRRWFVGTSQRAPHQIQRALLHGLNSLFRGVFCCRMQRTASASCRFLGTGAGVFSGAECGQHGTSPCRALTRRTPRIGNDPWPGAGIALIAIHGFYKRDLLIPVCGYPSLQSHKKIPGAHGAGYPPYLPPPSFPVILMVGQTGPLAQRMIHPVCAGTRLHQRG